MAYYINLLQGSMSTAINLGAARSLNGSDTQAIANDVCGGLCDQSKGEVCRPDGQCAYPNCQDVAPYCDRSSSDGVRARQICPVTCGCDQPRSSLALFLPESGCPNRCQLTTTFRSALAIIPCEDVSKDDPSFTGFLAQWYDAANTWPKDWKESGQVYVELFQIFGCDYLNMNHAPEDFSTILLDRPTRNSTGLFWPANFGVGVNPCTTYGFYYPIKPLSFFCPVSCGCRGGDAACPDTCPPRIATSDSDGVDHIGMEPNPSPWNVAGFPWRYSHVHNTSHCNGEIQHCPHPNNTQ